MLFSQLLHHLSFDLLISSQIVHIVHLAHFLISGVDISCLLFQFNSTLSGCVAPRQLGQTESGEITDGIHPFRISLCVTRCANPLPPLHPCTETLQLNNRGVWLQGGGGGSRAGVSASRIKLKVLSLNSNTWLLQCAHLQTWTPPPRPQRYRGVGGGQCPDNWVWTLSGVFFHIRGTQQEVLWVRHVHNNRRTSGAFQHTGCYMLTYTPQVRSRSLSLNPAHWVLYRQQDEGVFAFFISSCIKHLGMHVFF